MTTMTVTNRVVRFEKTFALAFPIDRVFRAFTDSTTLKQWLCDDAQFEPRVGGAYRFWGASVPFIPSSGEAKGKITAIELPTLLEFALPFRGASSNVSLKFESSSRSETKLTITHIADAAIWPRENEAPWVLSDFWKFAVGNLRTFLTEGRRAVRTDFTDRSSEVAMHVIVNAPPSRVFAALTDPKLMNRWLSQAARVEPRAGGKYDFGWTEVCADNAQPTGPRNVIEIVPNRLLVHDWHHGNEPVTRVRWELEELAGGKQTRVTLRHARYDDKETNDGYRQGWAGYLVDLWQFVQAS